MAQDEQIIVSDLLSYMACNISIYEKSLLIKTVTNFYSDGVIFDALDILTSSIANQINDRLKDHTESNPVCSIYDYLQLIPKSNMPIFVCRNLDNLPDIESEELNMNENPIIIIQKHHQNMKAKIKDISASVSLIRNQMQSLIHSIIRYHLKNTDPSDCDILKKEPIQNIQYLQSIINKHEMEIQHDTSKSEQDQHIERDITIGNSQEEALSPLDELNGLPNHRTIQFEDEDGTLLMTASDDTMTFDDSSNIITENIHRIEVSEDGDDRTKNKQNLLTSNNVSHTSENEYFSIKIENNINSKKAKYIEYKCSQCNYSSDNYINTANHPCVENAVHCSKSTSYECKLCNFISSHIFKVNEHLFIHEEYPKINDTFECFWCSDKNDSTEELKNHLSRHTIIAPFACIQCSFRSLDVKKLRNHCRRHWEEKGPHEFECQLCYKICGTRQALDKHKLMHKRKYNHKCPYCGITYKNKSALTQHTLSHTKEKLFSCMFCSMVCESLHSLNEHKKTHNTVKEYICHICDIHCKNRYSHRVHVLSKHPRDKRFNCDICKETFHFKRSLQIHRKKHIGNERFSCDECSKKFKSALYLKVHQSMVHKSDITCTIVD